MCYHVSVPRKKQIAALIGNAIATDNWDERYEHLSAHAHRKLPVLTTAEPSRLQAYSWGLIPGWCSDETKAKELRKMTVNAKSETVFSLPSFRTSIAERRCLIFVDGFYEWRLHGKTKYPYFIYMNDREAFAMGGIYDEWVNPATGEIIPTCSVITTPANALLSRIHNQKQRMPLILPKEKMWEWIKPGIGKETILQLMQPLPEGMLTAHTISKRITSRTEDPNVPEVKEKFVYVELPELGSEQQERDLFTP